MRWDSALGRDNVPSHPLNASRIPKISLPFSNGTRVTESSYLVACSMRVGSLRAMATLSKKARFWDRTGHKTTSGEHSWSASPLSSEARDLSGAFSWQSASSAIALRRQQDRGRYLQLQSLVCRSIGRVSCTTSKKFWTVRA